MINQYILGKEGKKLITKFGNAHIDNAGYYIITTSKNKKYKGQKLHRLIWSDYWGIDIPKNMVIHHRDENKLNNNPDNLAIMFADDHSKLYRHDEGRKRQISETRAKKYGTTDYMYVRYRENNKLWIYERTFDGKRKSASSKSLEKLKEKVIANGWEWKRRE